jgi:hypothetical protein
MNVIAIPIIGMLIPIVIVPVALGIKFATHKRELEHAERMKALELDRTLPRDEPWSSPARISLSIGAGVPIGAFFCAWMASNSVGYREEMWLSATLVGITAVISGTVLAAMHFTHRARAENLAAGLYPKPDMDADAFDVVSSRG